MVAKSKPRRFDAAPTLPDTSALVAFTEGAGRGTIDIVRHPIETQARDRDAKPTNGINLRLNDYELDLVRKVAAQEDRSIQKTIKRILIPALEKALK